MNEFSNNSGLILNPTKSQLFCTLNKVVIQDIFGIPSCDLLVKYLGLPLLAGNLSNAACAPLVDKVQRRLQTWTGLYLSKAGRMELIKTILFSFSHYWTAGFALPKKTIKTIHKILRRFLWSGDSVTNKQCAVNWGSVCSPKSGSKSWVRPLTRFIIFEGHSINIWDDPWLQGYGLRHHFHNQALLSWGPIDQAKVSLFIKDGRWVKPNRWPTEFNDVWNSIIEMDIGRSGPDILIWPGHKTGQITTPAAWNHVRKHHPPLVWTSEVWNSIQPPRYSFLLWQAALNRLPTKDRLWKRQFATSIDEKQILHFILSQTIWLIWKARNEKIFKGSITPKKKLVYQIIHSAKFRFSGEVIEEQVERFVVGSGCNRGRGKGVVIGDGGVETKVVGEGSVFDGRGGKGLEGGRRGGGELETRRWWRRRRGLLKDFMV
ncbi:hypothetical protein QJS10_CPB12g01036 [Acorus calamus]|uniref:Reverse transcriptase zinc-binding domain-containing protein n=1 Tax=Acorus calamus TaxID=4465 RepID=A0AAV9DLL5_ACOCL|nr:hypothetical protein QJS10_CPB12g01036 [Acorus calamus]